MMKILFGIQGTGNGHISRCRTLAKALSIAKAEVDYIFSGRDAKDYFDMDAFGDYKIYEGMSFATQNGKINLHKTIKRIRGFRLIKDVRDLDLSQYDMIISDFEPVSAWAAHHRGRESLGISNQAVCQYFKPKEYGLIANTIMKFYAPVTKPIGLHWFHFGHALVPPIIDPLICQHENGKIIVYLPFESIEDIISFLLPFSQRYEFECYHPNIKQEAINNAINLKPLSRDTFTNAVSACSGIIANTGFALISEALVLGKKVLTKPVSGQFEQIYNAECLAKLDLATVMNFLDQKVLEKWLTKPSPSPIVYPDVATHLANWIVSGQQESLAELSNRLWQKTEFPPHVQQKIRALGYAI
ncbi:glycosyltransferase family protein [Orbus sturtevantii]|uniref:MJ1255/VC2487 family glycosyltransferase n=1 Tax=Orbus sturtevantii TaxID=3074109 RepID=UPI00370DA561